jgi:hypothetical protein
MLRERDISESWVLRALASPDRREPAVNGTVHLLKAIPEHGGRVLRVVVQPDGASGRIVTLFFDRRVKGPL